MPGTSEERRDSGELTPPLARRPGASEGAGSERNRTASCCSAHSRRRVTTPAPHDRMEAEAKKRRQPQIRAKARHRTGRRTPASRRHPYPPRPRRPTGLPTGTASGNMAVAPQPRHDAGFFDALQRGIGSLSCSRSSRPKPGWAQDRRVGGPVRAGVSPGEGSGEIALERTGTGILCGGARPELAEHQNGAHHSRRDA